MIFDGYNSPSLLCLSINLIRITLSMSACHFVTFTSPSSTLLSSIHAPFHVSPLPQTAILNGPSHPIPQTHQSVRHSTKDDKVPEGIKRRNRIPGRKCKREKKRVKAFFFFTRLSPIGPKLWDIGS